MKLIDDIRHHLAALNFGQQQREAAVLLREAAAAMDAFRWIPVSERLPEVGTDVLCHFEGRLYVGYYDGSEWQDDDHWRDCDYWMPLPKKPE